MLKLGSEARSQPYIRSFSANFLEAEEQQFQVMANRSSLTHHEALSEPHIYIHARQKNIINPVDPRGGTWCCCLENDLLNILEIDQMSKEKYFP